MNGIVCAERATEVRAHIGAHRYIQRRGEGGGGVGCGGDGGGAVSMCICCTHVMGSVVDSGRTHLVPLVRIPEPCHLVGAPVRTWVPAPDWPCLRRRRGWRQRGRQRGRQRISGCAPSQPHREQQQRCGTSRLQSTMGAARSRGTDGAHYLSQNRGEREQSKLFLGRSNSHEPFSGRNTRCVQRYHMCIKTHK